MMDDNENGSYKICFMKKKWAEYTEKVSARLAKGESEYEGRSFSKEPLELLTEIEEELLDISGWSFIMWQRITQIKEALHNAPAAQNETLLDRTVSALESIAATVKSKLDTTEYTVTYVDENADDA